MRPIAVTLLALLCACGGTNGTPEDGGQTDAIQDASDQGNDACEIPAEPGGLSDCNFDGNIAFDHLKGTVLQLESADGQMCARLDRRDDSPFPDGSVTLWTLLEVRIGRPGSVAHVDEPNALCWKVSHHNWDDAARIWSGTNRYDLDLMTIGGHAGESTNTLTVYENGPLDPEDTYCLRTGSTPRCAPIELFPFNP